MLKSNWAILPRSGHSCIHAALSLANAKLIVKGCASRADALCRLYEARVSEDVVDAFKAADDAKQIAYPI